MSKQKESSPELENTNNKATSLAEKLEKLAVTGTAFMPIDALNLIKEIIQAFVQIPGEGKDGIHYDLKPENILISETGEVILVNHDRPPDSPLRKSQTAVTSTGQLDYRSPEQLEHRPVTMQSNIYALGVILYELLAGHRPQLPKSAWGGTFEPQSLPQEVPLEEVQPGLTPATYTVVRESLRRQPWARYDSLTDMAIAVESALTSEQTAVAKLAAASERNNRPLLIIAGIVAILLICLAGFFLLRDRISDDGTQGDTAVSQPRDDEAIAAIDSEEDEENTNTNGQSIATAQQTPEATATSFAPTATATAAPTETASPTPMPPTATPTVTATPTPTPVPVPEGMVFIPAGSVLVGSSGGRLDEAPEHLVSLDSFFIDQFEVSNAQYRSCVTAEICTPSNLLNAFTYSNYRNDPTYDNFPAIGITWDQANNYCQWADKRLPSEAEWEYAASGPENYIWPWGNEFDATLSAASARDIQAVDSYPEGVSPFGVYNMSGNVVEWVLDVYDETFYANSPEENPVSSGESGFRIYRGGSFGTSDGTSSTTSRRYIKHRSFFDIDVGFRCAMDAPE